MTELPYRSEHVHDYMADSDDLSNEEMGAYIRLQRAMWRAGGYLPAKELARFCRAGKRWGSIAPAILRKLTVSGGLASCSIVLEQLLRTRERRAKAVERASKGGQATAAKRSAGRSAMGQIIPLNAAKPLKDIKSVPLEAAVEQSYGDATHNQKNLESKSLSTDDSVVEARDVYEIGVRLLTDRVGVRNLAARSQVAKWLAAVVAEGDLVDILDSAEAENLRGANFVAVVDQRVRVRKGVKERGQMLPFGFQPNVVPNRT